MQATYEIIAKNGHYEVYNQFNQFILSGDTYAECEQDLDELLSDGF